MTKETTIIISNIKITTVVKKTRVWLHIKTYINGKFIGSHSVRDYQALAYPA